MRDRKEDNVTIYQAKLLWPNFRAAPDKYNARGGKRYFSIALTEEQAHELKSQGWNVKWPKPRTDPDYDPTQDSRTPTLQIKVHYSDRSRPRVALISARGRQGLPEDLVDIIDTLEIQFVDVTFRPYDHDMNGGGRAAYLVTIFATMAVDELEEKYAHLPEVNENPRALPASRDDDFIEGKVLSSYDHPRELEM